VPRVRVRYPPRATCLRLSVRVRTDAHQYEVDTCPFGLHLPEEERWRRCQAFL